MVKRFLLLIICLMILSSTVFSMTQEEARTELQKRYTPYTNDVTNVNYFFAAVSKGDKELAKIWLIAGFNINTKNSQGYSPLHLAILTKNINAIKLLLDLGADVNLVDSAMGQGLTPLKWAIELKQTDTIDLLLKAGADVNIRGSKGGVALFSAAYYGDIDLVKKLLAAGADISISNNEGKTVMDFALEGGHQNIAQLLRTSGLKGKNDYMIPKDYPSIITKTSLCIVDENSIELAKQEVLSLKKADKSYYLGYKTYTNIAEMFTKIANGKTDLYYFMETPYSGIRYQFFKANRQFKPVNNEMIEKYKQNKDFVYINIITQDVDEANIFEASSGYYGNKREAIISNVVIRINGTVYPSIAQTGFSWVFPIDIFSSKSDIEIIVIDSEDDQKILTISAEKMKKFK